MRELNEKNREILELKKDRRCLVQEKMTLKIEMENKFDEIKMNLEEFDYRFNMYIFLLLFLIVKDFFI